MCFSKWLLPTRRGRVGGRPDPHDVVDAVLARLAERPDDPAWISLVEPAALRARADELAALRRPDLPLYGVPVRRQGQHRRRRAADHRGLPRLRLPRRDGTPAASRGCSPPARSSSARRTSTSSPPASTAPAPPTARRESVFGGDLISGGSSSGCAVAVASGVVAFALGTDTAGSGRVPAAMNGIVGLKPTRGLVGTSGVVPACRSLDCVSVFARDVADAAAVLAVLAGPRPRRPVVAHRRAPSTPPPGPGSRWPTGSTSPATRRWRPRSPPSPVRAAARGGVDRAGRRSTPLVEAGDLLYTGPWVAERLAGLERVPRGAPRRRPAGRSAAVVERGRDFTAVDAFRARHRLQELRAACARIWESADVLLLPTVPTTFTRAQLAEEPVGPQPRPRPLHAVREPARPGRARRPRRHHARRAAGRRHPARPGVLRGPPVRRRHRVDRPHRMIAAAEEAA